MLGCTEEALEVVRRPRDPRIVEALEQVLSIPLVAADESIDEASGRRTKTYSWRVGYEGAQEGLEAVLCLGC